MFIDGKMSTCSCRAYVSKGLAQYGACSVGLVKVLLAMLNPTYIW